MGKLGKGLGTANSDCPGHRRWCWLDVGCREPLKQVDLFGQKAENLQKEARTVAGLSRLRQAKWPVERCPVGLEK